MTIFNPNDIGQSNGNLFGLPNKYQQAEVVVLPVPWDVTVSYGDGTSSAPERILEESLQVDLFDLDYGNFWEQGISYLKSSEEIEEKCQATRPYAVEAIKLLEKGNHIDSNSTLQKNTEKVNKVCSEMIDWVHTEALKLILDQKKVVLLGGDHSTPLGYLKALDSQNESFGILQIDAHCDLRDTYEGFEYSHASIMYNAMKLKNIS
ncbi:MAG: arginase family protein, partial [Chitinophagales bacterium]